MTSPNSLEKIIPQSLASLFQCAQIQHSGLLGIQTPFQYPDGGIVDIYVEPRPNARGEYEVSDMDDAMLFLSMHTPDGEPSPFQLSFADETCLTIGIEAEHDILKAKAADMDHIAAAVLNIAQAACQVSAVSFYKTGESGAKRAEEYGNGNDLSGPPAT